MANMNPMQVIETQNEIIKLQSDAIDDLFRKLMEHITAAEADKLPVLDKLNTAAKLRNKIE